MNTMAFPSLYRHVTPPAGVEYLQPGSVGSTHTSVHSFSYNSSPTSDVTNITTPPRSPNHSKQHGTVLLPKVRSQDQNIDPSALMSSNHHRRNTSSISSISSAGFPSLEFHHRVPSYHRSVSPPSCNPLGPVSEHVGSMNFGGLIPRSASANRARSLSRTHSRSSSLSNIDDAAIRKYVCPSQRVLPSFTQQATSSLAQVSNASQNSTPTPAAEQPSQPEAQQSNLPELAPSFQFPAPQQQQTSLAPELLFDSYSEPPAETNLLSYLTAPNPSPALVRRTTVPNRQFDMHFWWDVRNIRTWHDFSLETINSIPGLTDLLEFPLPQPGLPTPPAANLHPETMSALHDTHADHYLTKVNKALEVSLGTAPLSIRAHKPASPAPAARAAAASASPDFLANHPSDYERTTAGAPRARVVGLVRTFDAWNSGMRAEGPGARIAFLRELAALHRHMREHHARYGFILTEIELVCVRAGADAVPLFGLLELAPPVRLEASGAGTMTAPLALWYLHMLAKNAPLPGQPGWRMDVGAPAALSRQRCLERDQWMVRPEGREKRDAKRNRGWVECTEPLSRKEIKPWKGARRAA